MSQQRAGRHRHKWRTLGQVLNEPMQARCNCGKVLDIIPPTEPPVAWRGGIVATDGTSIVWYGPRAEVMNLWK